MPATKLLVQRLLLLGMLLASPGLLCAQQVERSPRRIRESVSLDTDSSVVKKLGTVRDYLDLKQWARAIEMIGQISTDHGDTLILVMPGRYVNVGTYCNLLLAGLPSEGLAVYRRKIDPQARQWFEAGKRQRDETAVRKVLRHAFVSSYGDDALDLLGEWAWERGEIAAARSYWEQVFPLSQKVVSSEPLLVLRYPDTDLDRAELLARLILCSLAEGSFPRAELERKAFKRLHPDAQGALAGRQGKLAEILDAIAAEARQWKVPAQEAAVGTFALNAQRNRVLPRSIDVGASPWSVALTGTRLLTEPRRAAFHKNLEPLSYNPVVFGDVVLLNDADHIFAWNVHTGKPAWSGGDESSAIIYPPVPGDRLPLPTQSVLGVPRYTMTIHEGRLYAKMGTPITSRAKFELQNLPSKLICLDLARGQGKLVWQVLASNREAGWAFEGSPVVAHGRVYVALHRNQPQTQTNVACYESETGKLLWTRKVCAAVADVDEGHNFVSHHLLTLAQNTVFYSTEMGAIAALDARNGLLQWVVTYERKEQNSRQYSNHMKQGLTPCLFHQGVVVAAPNDYEGLMAIDAQTGIMLWKRNLPGGVRHLLGVGRGKLIVSGNRLWGLDLMKGGRVDWWMGSDDPETYGYGRGVLAEDVVFWPKRDEIFIVDQATGVIRRRVALSALHGEKGGNLTIADKYLLVAQPQRLVAFCEYGLLKKRRKAISANPLRRAREVIWTNQENVYAATSASLR